MDLRVNQNTLQICYVKIPKRCACAIKMHNIWVPDLALSRIQDFVLMTKSVKHEKARNVPWAGVFCALFVGLISPAWRSAIPGYLRTVRLNLSFLTEFCERLNKGGASDFTSL